MSLRDVPLGSTAPSPDTPHPPHPPQAPASAGGPLPGRPGDAAAAGVPSLWQTIALMACLTLLTLSAVAVWWGPVIAERYAAAAAVAKVEAEYRIASEFLAGTGARETLTYRLVTRKVMPSVVNINATFPGQDVVVRNILTGGVYRDRLPGQAGQGSGVIIAVAEPARPGEPAKPPAAGEPAPAGKARLFILTNHHVVTFKDPRTGNAVPAERIDIDVPGRPKGLTATVYGLDPGADIALLVPDETEGLTPADLGDSDAVEPGDRVLAFGSPFGLQHTVTEGIISARDRTGLAKPGASAPGGGGAAAGATAVTGDRVEFLQTSAAINPGNSGGALVDMAGRVIGVNTAILSRSGGSHGIGFAVPINTVKATVAHILANHGPEPATPVRIRRGRIGVFLVDAAQVAPEARRSLALPDRGAVIGRVLAGGPAALAGLRPGDYVLAADGQPVPDVDALRAAIAARSVGETIGLSVSRMGRRLDISVPVAEIVSPEDNLPAPVPGPAPGNGNGNGNGNGSGNGAGPGGSGG
jgi:serine protease Do